MYTTSVFSLIGILSFNFINCDSKVWEDWYFCTFCILSEVPFTYGAEIYFLFYYCSERGLLWFSWRLSFSICPLISFFGNPFFFSMSVMKCNSLDSSQSLQIFNSLCTKDLITFLFWMPGHNCHNIIVCLYLMFSCI